MNLHGLIPYYMSYRNLYQTQHPVNTSLLSVRSGATQLVDVPDDRDRSRSATRSKFLECGIRYGDILGTRFTKVEMGEHGMDIASIGWINF